MIEGEASLKRCSLSFSLSLSLLLRAAVFQMTALCEKCPYSELFSPNGGKCGPEQLRIWTHFPQCCFYKLHFRFSIQQGNITVQINKTKSEIGQQLLFIKKRVALHYTPKTGSWRTLVKERYHCICFTLILEILLNSFLAIHLWPTYSARDNGIVN